jgi:hypothetical protein
MALEKMMNVVYLSSGRSLPSEFKQISRVNWHCPCDKEKLIALFNILQGEIIIVVQSESLSSRTIQAFFLWIGFYSSLSFVFIAKNVEPKSFQITNGNPRILILEESEGVKIEKILTRRLRGEPAINRKRERLTANSFVILQKSKVMSGPAQVGTEYLGSGRMVDFSRGGAQVILRRGSLHLRDFFQLVYRDVHGEWVTIESQVRWHRSQSADLARVGIQFIALSA